MLFSKKRQKNVLKQTSQVQGVLFSRYCIQLQIEWYQPLSVSFLCVEKLPKYFQKCFRNKENFMLFLKKRQKKVLKQNSQVGGFFFPRTAFNYKSNGINPPSVSFLCVEKLPK